MRHSTCSIKIILVCAIVSCLEFLPGTGMHAQQAWTLRQCIDYALEHNLTVKRTQLALEASDIDLQNAKAARLPAVSSSLSENLSFGRGLTADNTYSNTNTTTTGFSIVAEVPVFRGFAIKHNIDIGKLNLEAAIADLDKARDDIRIAVAKAFVQILYSQEIESVAEAQISLDSLQVERLEQMLANGKASAAELARQKASLAQSRLQLTQARGNVRMALLDLAQLLELPSPEGFGIVAPHDVDLGAGLLENPQDVYDCAVGARSGIVAEMRRLDVARTRIELAKSSYYPTVSLNGGLGTNYYTASALPSAPFGQQIKNNFSQFLGLSVNIPIFDRFSTRNAVKNAKLNFQNQNLVLENTRKGLYKEIQQAYYNALSADEKYSSTTEVVASMEEAFRLTTAKYENGKASITEFNEAKNNLSKSRSDLAQARYEDIFQRALLRFYKEGDITL